MVDSNKDPSVFKSLRSQANADWSASRRAENIHLTSLGASPSNTAPTNDISRPIQILRYGIDSLYVSFKGNLSPDWDDRLHDAKNFARSEDPKEQLKGQITICDQLFEVKSSGRSKFAYVLADGWFQIQVSATNSKSLPLAYVQISSELLTNVGVEGALEKLLPIINTLGSHQGANMSRIDLCVDFTSGYMMDSWKHDAWVTRAQHIDPHYVNGQFSGWSIGRGGSIVCRLYNKTLEIKKSKKDYLFPLWMESGWNGIDDVWRCEYQIRSGYLRNTSKKLSNVLLLLDALWQYVLLRWCRLSVPNDTDTRHSRWPTHPLWQTLSTVDWNTPSDAPLTLPPQHRAPSDEYLFVNGLSAFTSFMARENMLDLDEGIGEYLARAQAHHDQAGKGEFAKYIRRKTQEKQRRFNTANHNINNGVNEIERQERAEAYRKAKEGE